MSDGDLELVDPSTLEPHPDNPRVHADARIRRSIEDHGVIDVCVVQRSRRRILGGHGRWENAQAAGATKVPVLWVDCDDAEAEEILLVLNRTADEARYDNPRLAAILSRIADSGREVARSGWDAEDLRRFVTRAQVKAGGGPTAEEDDGTDLTPPEQPTTKPGDRWLLGEHVLLCGDATVAADVERCLGGVLADLVWTDPPYGVDYVGKTDEALTIEGDESTEVAVAAFPVILAGSRPGAVWYVCSPSGPGLVDFAGRLVELGVYRQQLVWLKDHFVLGRSDFHARHESILFGAAPVEPAVPLLYGWTPGAAHEFLGDRTLDTVWEFPRPARSIDHPTMKPVPLVGRAIELSSYEGDVVLDPFAGSGPVLVACEQLGRRARLIEIDARYCDVILRRWTALTGDEPKLDG